MKDYRFTQLDELESEAIFIIREVASEFQNPAILFSGGKDSIVLSHLAKKAFYPSNIPFPFIHIDTGHNFPETIEFRDYLTFNLNVKLIIGSVQQLIDNKEVIDEKGKNPSRNSLQIPTLLKCLNKYKIDGAIGGARRDEEKARAKERFFSHRDEFGQWNPKKQRPELWNTYNTNYNHGEHFRIFPISNWTEIDVWKYIKRENIQIPSLYFSHKRECVIRENMLVANSDLISLKKDEKVMIKQVRFRTCGDIPITGAVESSAKLIDEIIDEISTSNITERGGRFDDKRAETAMEDRKIKGYF